MNRRALLKALPAAAAVGAAPALAQGGDTPVMQAYREWKERHDWLKGPEAKGLTDEEFDALTSENDKLVSRIAALPCQAPADLAAKFLATTFDGICELDDTAAGMMVMAEIRAMIGGVR